jgi:hypothetical protein
MEVRITARSGGSGTIAATDDERHRGFKLVVSEGRRETSATLTYGRKF